MAIAIPPTTTPPAIIAAPAPQTRAARQLRVASATNTLNSPKIAAAPQQIAQSELPGGSTPPTPPSPNSPPPQPSIRDTGSGYPSNIPANYFGPAIDFGNGTTSFGVISRFAFGSNFSLRPSAVFGSTTTVRLPITYDFGLGDTEPFERNPLIVFNAGGGVQFNSGNGNSNFGLLGTVGVDVNLFDGISLVGSFNTDFSNKNSGYFGLGFEF